MLQELHIKNLALIDSARVRFGDGFNVLTGETGAGKTVVVGAVSLLLGGRAGSTLIRKGCNKAEVVGVFSKSQSLDSIDEGLRDLFEDEDHVIIRRVISSDGKNKCYVNDRAVTVGSLAEIGRRCIDLHGQHEHQSLFKISTHVDFLDKYGGDELLALREKFIGLNKKLKRMRDEYSGIKGAEREMLGKKDLLQFQTGEIDAAGLIVNEDSELTKERDILRNAAKISEAVSAACAALADGEGSVENVGQSAMAASELVAQAASALSAVSGYDIALERISERLNSLLIEVDDCVVGLKEYGDGLDITSGRLEDVESRLALISLLKRKYGSTIDEILEYREIAADELTRCDTSGERMEQLEKEIRAARYELADLAVLQSESRKRAAESFAFKVRKELTDLNMPSAIFEVSFIRERDAEGLPVGEEKVKIQPNGIDKIEFMVSANKGEAVKNLAKVASGGEISRIMLALKIILADADEIPTLIFDEIDVGIGGKTAAAVGRKIAALARKHQVMSVTHLPQIASFADEHLTVLKHEADFHTVTSIERLDGFDRVREMARLLSGNTEAEVSLKHAEELLSESQGIKCRV